MAKIVTHIDVPDELLKQWIMHVVVFNRAHPDCKLTILAATHEANTDEVNEALRECGLSVATNKETMQ